MEIKEHLIKSFEVLEIKEVSDDLREFKALITTDQVDREGDVVIPLGVRIKDFLDNPIILHNHNKNEEVGRVMSIKPTRDGKALEVHGKLLPKGSDPDADRTWEKVKHGVLNAISIGFGNAVFRYPSKKDIETFGQKVKRVIFRSDLYEISLVAVPANPGAKIFERKDLNKEEIIIEEVEPVILEDNKEFDILVEKIKNDIKEEQLKELEKDIVKDTIKEQIIKSRLFKNGNIYY